MRRPRSPDQTTTNSDNNGNSTMNTNNSQQTSVALPAWRAASSSVPPLYAVLGITDTSITDKAVQQTYKKLALLHHPDRVNNTNTNNSSSSRREEEEDLARARFQEIQAAYAVLGDAKKRSEYDGQHGLNLNLRVGAIVNSLGEKHDPAATAEKNRGGIQLFFQQHDDTGRDGNKNNGGDDDDDDSEYAPGAGSDAKAKKEKKPEAETTTRVDVGDEWAALFAAEAE